MRPFTLLVACAVLAWSAVGVAAQARPDFAGRWTTDADPAAQAAAPPAGAPGGRGELAVFNAPQRGAGPGAGGGRGGARGDMGSGWGPTITITQDATRLTVEYAFFSRGDMQPPLRFAYALDGSETKNTVMMGHGMQTQSSKAAWDGEKLVITTQHAYRDPAGKPATQQVTQTLSLESATSLVVETTRAGVSGGPATSTKTTYRKL